jgi:hypothetical protein
MRWLAVSTSVMFPEHAGSDGVTAQSGRTATVRHRLLKMDVDKSLDSLISEPIQS